MLVQIPAPERFAIHKLIISERRRGPDRAKAAKDRAQAAALIEALAEHRPDELAAAYGEARGEGPRWVEALDGALARDPALRERLQA